MGKDYQALVMYDNFLFQENIKYQRIGNNAIIKSVITSKLIIGTDIPDGGLKQTLLDESVRLTSLNIFNTPELYKDVTQLKISIYFIVDTI